MILRTKLIINSYLVYQTTTYNSCGHTTDFYLGKNDLPRANSSKISRGKWSLFKEKIVLTLDPCI